VDLWSTSIILNAGHRLRISVSSSNYPRFAASLNNGLDFPESVRPLGGDPLPTGGGGAGGGSAGAGGGYGTPVTVNLHHSAQYPSYLEVPDPSREPDDYNDCSSAAGGGGAGGNGGAGGAGAAAGGAGAQGGAAGAGGSTAAGGTCPCQQPAPDGDDGCSCRLRPSSGAIPHAALLLAALALGLARRRRQRRS